MTNFSIHYQSIAHPSQQPPSAPTPQGFTAFFDRGQQPRSAAQFAFDSFECHQPVVLPTTMGTSAFFDPGKQPPSAAEQPFSSFQARGTIVSTTPQGFSAFFDPGKQPASAAQHPFNAFTPQGTIVSITPQGFTAFFDYGYKQPYPAADAPFAGFYVVPPPIILFGVSAIGQVGSLIGNVKIQPFGVSATGQLGTLQLQISSAGGYSLYHGPERNQSPRPAIRKRVTKTPTLPPHEQPEGSVERPAPLPPFANVPQVALPMGPMPGTKPVDFSNLVPGNPMQLGQTIKDAHARSEVIEAIRILTDLGLLQ